MDTEELIEHINQQHARRFRLQQRYATGENQGAFTLVDAAGDRFVLKWQPQPAPLERLQRAQRITDHLRGLGLPVPAYVLLGAVSSGATYWVQTALAGAPPGRLTLPQAEQLLRFNDVQAERALSTDQNWSTYVRAVLFAGESGWADSLRSHSPATRVVLARLERLVAGKAMACGHGADIVHGDVALENVLVDRGRVSGVVDWDAAGCGDRVLDLAKLLFYAYAEAAVRRLLWTRIVALRGHASLAVHLAYCVLAQLDWSIHHHPQAAVDDGVAFAHALFDDLEAAE